MKVKNSRKEYHKKFYSKVENKDKRIQRHATQSAIGRNAMKAIEVLSTEQAISFGKAIKDNPYAIDGVLKAKEFWESKEYSNDKQAIINATRVQLCRECLEAAKYKGDK